jgi:hypothetical protein
MSFYCRIGSRLAVFGLLLLPQLVLAGIPSNNGVVIIGPLDSLPIPLLSGTGLIVLGLLLAVVAIRMFRNHQGAFSVLGVLALTGSVVTGGVGIEKAWASGVVVAGGDVCHQAGPVNFNPEWNYNYLDNQCPNSLQIISISASCSLNGNPSSPYSTCEEGGILLGQGEGSENARRCALRWCDEN